VILISVDTLRADHLSCYGYRAAETRNIDAIAAGGTRYMHVSAQIPLTLPSHVSLLSSTYPFVNGVRDNGQTLSSGARTLATVLHTRGYRTGAFIASFVLDRRFGLSQGFDEYNGNFDVRQANTTDPGNLKRSGNEVVESAMAWIRQEDQRPFFLFLHLYDLHTPYRIPRRTGHVTYDDALAYEDSVIGRFWSFLSGQGLLNHTLTVFTADHGEGLGDHGESAHGYFVYQSTLRVPLLVHWPQGSRYPAVVDRAAALIDVAPTILDYLGIPRPFEFQGQSLMTLVPGGREQPQIYGESTYAQRHFACSSLASWSDGRYKYIESSKPELYDLLRDPGEQNNLYDSRRVLAVTYHEQLRAFTTPQGSPARGEKQQSSADAVTRLRSLGYLAGTSAAVSSATSGPAPQERLAAWEQYGHALALAAAGERPRAAQILLQMLSQTPDLIDVRLSLGLLWQQQGRHKDAAAEFRRVLQQDPKIAMAHFNLGTSLAAEGQADAAADEFKAALALEPNYTRAEEVLAGQMLERGRFSEAQAHYEHILKIAPGDFGAHYNLGALAASREQWDDARHHLEAALRINPSSAEAHNVLGSVWFRQGQMASAQREFAEAIRLSPKMSMAHYNLGLVLQKGGNPETAEREFRLALECDPRNQAARRALARQN
jgi:arylsulfatase A-like enzyme/tetratricopeptide (TPR) repeat protein